MKFDLIATNPPFQDTVRRGKTPHKLWIEFTKKAITEWLEQDGYLAQVSPSSFRSPNSPILDLIKNMQTQFISFDTESHFPNVGSSFAHYVIRNAPRPSNHATSIVASGKKFTRELHGEIVYLPNVLEAADFGIHEKVMFQSRARLDVRWDYVTCHNIRIHDSDTLSRERTRRHKYPVLHTNKQTWWSSIQQEFATKKKVMWSRSGYTKPFLDRGLLGGTDMAYYVLVSSVRAGVRLEKILNLSLFQYIYATAKWSGFGNERVFRLLPSVPEDVEPTDSAVFQYFELTEEEVSRVREIVE